ncbi:MAG: Ig-like domain-containing protein [Muribaculum sp.]|nr:Ig-like domain-containing protein [Muribaculum sp.]
MAAAMLVTSLPQTVYAESVVPGSAGSEAVVSERAVSEVPGSADGTDSGERIAPGQTVSSETGDAGGYLIDDTQGVVLTDVAVTPGSYSATFSFRCDRPVISDMRLVYTKDEDLADSFFPGVTKITLRDVNASEFYFGDLNNRTWQTIQDENGGSHYELAGEFVENGSVLTPNTTYYYRLVYRESSDYYFVSLPGQFTTGAPVETSAVTISSPQVEAGYKRTQIVWTVANPDNEYTENLCLRNVNTNQTKSAVRSTDSNGDIIPGRYEAVLSTQEDLGTWRPELYVYTGDAVRTPVVCEETVTLEDSDAAAHAQVNVTEEAGYDSFRAQVQITPWCEVDNGNWITVNLYYRQQGAAEWQKQSGTPYFRSGVITLSLSDLAKETAYEYYIELIPDYLSESVWKIGSEAQPCTFSTKEIAVYEDSLFPDDAFRNFIKQQIGIAETETITGDKLDNLTSLSWHLEPEEGDAGGDKRGGIRSIEGIQYLKNLTKVDFYNHAIADAGILGTMPQLTSITLHYNELTEMPDLSALTNLQFAGFTFNYIMSGITADKLPAEYLKKNPDWISATEKHQRAIPIPLQTPSQEEIKAQYAQLLDFNLFRGDTYAVQPITKSPYLAGRLSDESLQGGLKVINFIRYVAGIPSNVTLDESYMELAQTGALVNCVNDEMSHYPVQPKGFPDDLYKLGYTGCSSSNLGMGFGSIISATLDGWMHDSDEENLGKGLGHRRWVLDPQMQATGFGHVGKYTAMYVFDGNNYQGTECTTISDFVAWPAQNMPLELMEKWDKYGEAYGDYAWTVSLGADYAYIDAADVTVTLKDVGTGQIWTFNQKSSSSDPADAEHDYFQVNINGYSSMTKCIVFRPAYGEIVYDIGSQFEVNISGLKDRFGEEKPISYTVNFFAVSEGWDVYLSPEPPYNRTMTPGETLQLSAYVKYDQPTDDAVLWSSSNPGVVTVEGESKANESGFWRAKLTAVSEGEAVVTVSYRERKSYYYITVTGKGGSTHDYYISRTEATFDLAEGTKTETLFIGDGDEIVRKVSWSSQDEGVASVSGQNGMGIVTPKGSGTTQITAKVGKDVEFTCQVTVEHNILTAVSLYPQECTLEKGAARQLQVYLSPSDTTLSKEFLWTSDQPEVASVDASGRVCALSKGTAVITVAANAPAAANGVEPLTAQCRVTVYETAVPAQENIPSGLQALTNVETSLSDVSLEAYEGWEWENGDISLVQFAGRQEKSFMAVYRKAGYGEYRTALPVSLTTLTGLSIAADKTVLGKGENTADVQAHIQWICSGSESVLSGYADTLQWSSSNPAVLTVTVPDKAPETDADAAAQNPAAKGVLLRAGTSSGKAVVTAQITLGDKTYTARQTFTVVDGAVAEFGKVAATEGFAETVRDGELCYEGRLEDRTGVLSVTVANAAKLTVKSSNAKVLSVGKVQMEDGVFRIPLTMKAAGMARLILTADDAAKSRMEVWCCVKDAKPNLSESVVTVNKLKTDGVLFSVYPNDGYTVTACELGGADSALFEALSAGEESGSYLLKAKKDTAKGSYRLTVKVTVIEQAAAGQTAADQTATEQTAAAQDSAAAAYELPLTVKVTEQTPKYKIKQSAKANLFYRDLGAPKLVVTSEETLTGLALTGCDFRLDGTPGTDAESSDGYLLVPDAAGTLTDSAAVNARGTLTLYFKGYEPVAVPYTVGVESRQPKLAPDYKTVTLYPNAGVTTARLQIKSGKQIFPMESVTAALRKADGCKLTKADGGLILDGADLPSGGSLTRTAVMKSEIELTCDAWTRAVILPVTVKADPGSPALKLQKSTLQLNADTATLAYDMAETEILWKSGAGFGLGQTVSVSAADAKSQQVIHDGIVFEQTGNKLIARLNNRSVAAGSYKFKVRATGTSAAPASLTVKVVHTEVGKAVKLSTKGSIDVLNRAGSFVTVTPALKFLNGQITDVALSGDFAHLFEAALNEKNQIVIRARETDEQGRSVALITKYNYNVNLALTVENACGGTMQITAPVKLKLKQGKPKLTATPKKPIFFSGAHNSVKLDVAASLKGAADPAITKIELINQEQLFEYREGVLTLRDNGAAAKGKSYSLQFRVTFRDQADNEKAAVVKVNAKVQ